MTGAAASVVSQGIGVITGLQDKFSWKGVALGAIGGAIGGGLGAIGKIAEGARGIWGTLGKVGSFLSRGDILANAARGMVSSVLTQGVALATGLQSKFSWSGVAAGAAVGAISGEVGKVLGVADSNFIPSSVGDYAKVAVTGLAGGIAGAATRTIIDGSDFGDNVLSVLPDIISNTIGTVVANSVNESLTLSSTARRLTVVDREIVRATGNSSDDGTQPLLSSRQVVDWLDDKDFWAERYRFNRDMLEGQIKAGIRFEGPHIESLLERVMPSSDGGFSNTEASFSQGASGSQYAVYRPGEMNFGLQDAGWFSDRISSFRRWTAQQWNRFTGSVSSIRIPFTNRTVGQEIQSIRRDLSRTFTRVQQEVQEAEEIVVRAFQQTGRALWNTADVTIRTLSLGTADANDVSNAIETRWDRTTAAVSNYTNNVVVGANYTYDYVTSDRFFTRQTAQGLWEGGSQRLTNLVLDLGDMATSGTSRITGFTFSDGVQGLNTALGGGNVRDMYGPATSADQLTARALGGFGVDAASALVPVRGAGAIRGGGGGTAATIGSRTALDAASRTNLLAAVRQTGSLSEAKGLVYAQRGGMRLGYDTVLPSLSYRGSQGIDLALQSSASGRFAVFEAKGGFSQTSLSALSTDRRGITQGSARFIDTRLQRYIRYGNGANVGTATSLQGARLSSNIDSFASFYGSRRTYQLPLTGAGVRPAVIVP